MLICASLELAQTIQRFYY